MKRRILSALLCTVMTISLAACGQSVKGGEDKGGASSEDEPVHIKVALFSDGADMTESQKKVFEEFTKENPNIIPEFQYITSDSYGSNWNGYLMKIQTMIASGNAPDICALGLEGVAFMAMNDLGLPMNDYLEAHPEDAEAIHMDAIADELKDIFVVDGNTYGVPYEANSVVVHIRKDIFEEAKIPLPDADWTWDDFRDICEQLKNSGVDAFPFGVPTNFFCLQGLLYSENGSPLNDDWSEAAINSHQCNRVFQFLQDSIWKYGYAPQPSDTITDTELIVQGKTAMGFWGRWVSDDYNASDLDDKIFVQTMPKGEGGHNTCAGSCGFVVLNSTKHPEEAMKVALWTAGQTYSEVFMKTGSLPANPTWGEEICATDGIIDNYEVMYDVYNKNEWRRSQDPPEYADLANIYSKYMDIIYANQAPVSQALDEAAKEINQCFKNSTYRDTDEEQAVIDSLFKN